MQAGAIFAGQRPNSTLKTITLRDLSGAHISEQPRKLWLPKIEANMHWRSKLKNALAK